MSVRVIVAGSRDFHNEEYTKKVLDEVFAKFEGEDIIVLSGGCGGADLEGEIYADAHQLKLEKYPALWKKYGKAAGPKRNAEMVEVADYAVVFSAGGNGSKSLISLAEKKGIPTQVYDVRNILECQKPNQSFSMRQIISTLRFIADKLEEYGIDG